MEIDNKKIEVDYIFYPKYWFISIMTLVLGVIVLFDIWLYKDFYNNQVIITHETVDAAAEELNFNLMQIENKLLQFSKQYSSQGLENKKSNEIIELLQINSQYKKYITKVELISKQDNTNLDKLIFENNKLYLVLETNLLDDNAILLFLDIEKPARLYLNKYHPTFELGFTFNIIKGKEHTEYILTANNNFINKNLDDISLYNKVVADELKLVESKNILNNPNWQISGFLELAAIQYFIIKLFLSSLLIVFVTLVVSYFIYKKLYFLEHQRIKNLKDKKYFQQRAEITLASISDGVIITNSTDQIVYVNYIIEGYLGVKLKALYFKTFDDLLPELALTTKSEQDKLKLNDLKIIVKTKTYYFDVVASKLFNDDNFFIGTAIFLHDITVKKQAQERINYLAYFDELTGLPNKLSLIDYYNKAIIKDNIFMSDNFKLFTLAINTPSLKNINDTIGYEHGDNTLLFLTRMLKGYVEKNSVNNKGLYDLHNLYRTGGDTFSIVIIYDRTRHGKSSMLFITNFINNLISELNTPIHINEQDIYLHFCFGISIYPDNFGGKKENLNKADGQALDSPKLLRYAEIAMSDARKKGMNKYAFYSKDINLYILENFNLENQLRKALVDNKLELLFHPQIDLKTNKLRGFEILVRWQREDGTVVLPDTFIPILEKSGLIVTVGDWILREACIQGLNLISEGIEFETLAVNISGLQLQSGKFIDRIESILEQTKFPKHKLELEVTETILFENTDKIIKILNQIRDKNIRIALDDFGTGFSSLHYLKDLPLDYLKIDRAFIRDIDNSGDTRLLSAILAIANTMNLITIAEGVETQVQVDFLRTHNCDIIQGYYISRPLSMIAIIDKYHSK